MNETIVFVHALNDASRITVDINFIVKKVYLVHVSQIVKQI